MVVLPVYHEQPRHDASEPSQLARRARARRRGWCAGQLALPIRSTRRNILMLHLVDIGIPITIVISTNPNGPRSREETLTTE